MIGLYIYIHFISSLPYLTSTYVFSSSMHFVTLLVDSLFWLQQPQTCIYTGKCICSTQLSDVTDNHDISQILLALSKESEQQAGLV